MKLRVKNWLTFVFMLLCLAGAIWDLCFEPLKVFAGLFNLACAMLQASWTFEYVRVERPDEDL